MRKFVRYILLFAAMVAVAVALLYLAGLVPQSALKQNMLESFNQLDLEGTSPGILYEGHPRSTLDNYSESRILMHSYYMDSLSSPQAILTNPGWSPEAFDDDTLFSESLDAIAGDAPSNLTYTRYWMGFRAIVRPLMLVMNYMDMRQLIQWTFFLLLGAVILQLYRKTGSFWIALGFMFTISQLNPIVISGCFQYSTCFFIAFIGMLLVLTMKFDRITVPMLFFILGGATQYFDFYTAPLITFGFPILALILRAKNNPGLAARTKSLPRLVLASLSMWFAAYVAMWLAKLALTNLFTNDQAFSDAFSRLKFWVLGSGTETSGVNAIPLALFYNAINIVDLVPLILESCILIAYLITVIRRKPTKLVWKDNLIYLLIGALPLLWIIAAARPAYAHMYFQYRILGITIFSGILFLLGTSQKNTIQPLAKA